MSTKNLSKDVDSGYSETKVLESIDVSFTIVAYEEIMDSAIDVLITAEKASNVEEMWKIIEEVLEILKERAEI